jgi:hypothetical protein
MGKDMSTDTFDLLPVSFERIPAGRYAELPESVKSNIKDVHIVPPAFADLEDSPEGDFGSIVIEYKTPVYKVTTR